MRFFVIYQFFLSVAIKTGSCAENPVSSNPSWNLAKETTNSFLSKGLYMKYESLMGVTDGGVLITIFSRIEEAPLCMANKKSPPSATESLNLGNIHL